MAANVMEIYGSKVFNEHVMKERLPSATYKSLERTLHKGAPLDIEVANVVASVMKRWAMELGATHYTHWFQPLTGITSEKHDGFVSPVGGVLRQGAGARRARCFLLPLRRPACHLRGPRLHRMGPHQLRFREG